MNYRLYDGTVRCADHMDASSYVDETTEPCLYCADALEGADQRWECIVSDPETGRTFVTMTTAPCFEDAVEIFEGQAEPGELYDGWHVFVPSVAL